MLHYLYTACTPTGGHGRLEGGEKRPYDAREREYTGKTKEDLMMDELNAAGWRCTMKQYAAGKKYLCLSPSGMNEFTSVKKAHNMHTLHMQQNQARDSASTSAAVAAAVAAGVAAVSAAAVTGQGQEQGQANQVVVQALQVQPGADPQRQVIVPAHP